MVGPLVKLTKNHKIMGLPVHVVGVGLFVLLESSSEESSVSDTIRCINGSGQFQDRFILPLNFDN